MYITRSFINEFQSANDFLGILEKLVVPCLKHHEADTKHVAIQMTVLFYRYYPNIVFSLLENVENINPYILSELDGFFEEINETHFRKNKVQKKQLLNPIIKEVPEETENNTESLIKAEEKISSTNLLQDKSKTLIKKKENSIDLNEDAQDLLPLRNN